MFHGPLSPLLFAPALLFLCSTQGACAGDLEEPRDSSAQPMEGPPVDTKPSDAGSPGDLPTKPGSPCSAGKCGSKLICMANICRSTCSTQCGDTAPECAANEGCYWITSFSAACLPGTANMGEACGESSGIICKPKHMCVAWGGVAAVCMYLCKYGCPSGTSCGDTANGCKVCHP